MSKNNTTPTPGTERFYDVRIRGIVEMPLHRIRKSTFRSYTGDMRWTFEGTSEDGRRLTKFVSKGDWDKFVEIDNEREGKDELK